MKMIAIALAALLWPTHANAQSDDFDAVGLYASCAALYRTLSEHDTASNKPASAEHMRAPANGAEFSAAYLLAAQDQIDNPGAKQRTYGEWINTVVRPKVDGEMLRIKAIIEAEDAETLSNQTQLCIDVGKTSQVILDAERKSRLDK